MCIRDRVRPFIGFAEIFAVAGDVSRGLIFSIIREIDATYELWGRVPTILGTLRRGGYRHQAKANAWYPRLWQNLVRLALKSQRPCEGAIVGGGCSGFHQPTSDPGVLWLWYWPAYRPSNAECVELRSHWGVSIEKLVGPGWEDWGFFGIYATLGLEDAEDPEQKPVSRGPPRLSRVEQTAPLPAIREEEDHGAAADEAAPRTAHEHGDWDPEERSADPFEFTPILDPIPEGSDESGSPSSGSFHTPEEEEPQPELLVGTSPSAPSQGPRSTNNGAQRVLWASRGSSVFAARLPADRTLKRNNQVLSAEEINEHVEEAWAAKGKEVGNFVVHRAIQAMQETGSEWNLSLIHI